MEFINPVFLLLWAAALCAILGLAHSVFGENMLIGPLLSADAKALDNPVKKQVTRLAWHWTSALWLLVGALLAVAAYGTDIPVWLLGAVGGAHLAFGLFDLIQTRGRHITWSLITFVGVLVLLALYVMQTAA